MMNGQEKPAEANPYPGLKLEGASAIYAMQVMGIMGHTPEEIGAWLSDNGDGLTPDDTQDFVDQE